MCFFYREMSKEKKCFVFGCDTSSKMSPNKIFVYVPRQPERRKQWFEAAQKRLTTTDVYCCESHFELKEDAVNWVKYQSVPGTKLILRPHVVPHIFLTPRKRKCSSQLTDSARKRREANASIFRSSSSSQTLTENHCEESQNDLAADATPLSALGVNEPRRRKQLLLPKVDDDWDSEYVAPDDRTAEEASHDVLELNDDIAFPLPVEDSLDNEYDEDLLDQPFVSWQEPSPASEPVSEPPRSSSASPLSQFPSSTFSYDETEPLSPSSTSSDELAREELKRLSAVRQITLLKLESRFYLGIPSSEMSVISNLSSMCGLSERDLMLTIKKLRTNDVFERIGHDFGISMQRSAAIFRDSLPIMSAWLTSFIYWPSSHDIRIRLPMQFRKRFSNVESIIDCFEVEIEKPSKAKHQALTWSRYKGCNTVKVLISSTPTGFINFISSAYGGRISDIKICSVSGYMEALPDGCAVLADRGFKQIESDLAGKSCVLIRPASVAADGQMSHEDVINTRRIASVRIHIERVISRVREFRFLDIHSRIDNHLLDLIDHAIVVVSALVNLQGPLIKM